MRAFFLILTIWLAVLFSCGRGLQSDINYTQGADTPEQLAESVLKAVRDQNVEIYLELVPNAEMEYLKQIVEIDRQIEQARGKKDFDIIKQLEKHKRMAEQSDNFNLYKSLSVSYAVSQQEGMTLLYQDLVPYVDWDNLIIEVVSAAPGTDSVQVQIKVRKGKLINTISLGAVRYPNARWYYTGKHSSGM